LLQADSIDIIIHLRGVYESNISLIPLSGSNALKPVFVDERVKNGDTAIFNLSDELTPGEFIIRFDYKESIISTPYPSEKRIIINNQDLELWVNPPYCNNNDSTWFQKGERENSTYTDFIKQNAQKRAMLGLLQEFLLNYDNPDSKFYRNGISEYEKKRTEFNKWINDQIILNQSLFVSTLFRFQSIPEIVWKGSDSDRKKSIRENYFEKMDFSDPLITRTTALKEWMDQYVNLFGELATSIELRDSLFILAGKNAIEMAKGGDPLVYGWMVDYFYNGYETNNIAKGIKMLEPYLNDPNCLTSKRQSINKRLKGMETLIPGVIAPDISMMNEENRVFELSNYNTNTEYILLLFWSADCSHCNQMVGELYAWTRTNESKKKPDIVAISVDETDNEIQAWKRKKEGLAGWTHLRAEEGIRSKVANDYSILSVPVMILLNSKTKEIIAMPQSVEKLNELLNM
jgi:thioredoxin-related protein